MTDQSILCTDMRCEYTEAQETNPVPHLMETKEQQVIKRREI